MEAPVRARGAADDMPRSTHDRAAASPATARQSPAAAPAKNAEPAQGQADTDTPPGAAEPTALVDDAEQPGDRMLFLAIGSALIPLGCSTEDGLRPGERCVEEHPRWNAWFPDAVNPVEAVRMKLRLFPSDDVTVGYRLSTHRGSRHTIVKGDVATFALGGKTGGLRAAKRGTSTELLPKAAIRNGLPGTTPSEAVAVRVRARVDRTLRKAGMASAVHAGMLEYSLAIGPGAVQNLYAVRVDPWGQCSEEAEQDACALASDLEMPDYLWLLIIEHEGKVHRLQTGRSLYYDGHSANYRVGEGGAVLSIVDLDGDGVDELVVAQKYAEGIWYELLQRKRPTRFRRVSRFGMGS